MCVCVCECACVYHHIKSSLPPTQPNLSMLLEKTKNLLLKIDKKADRLCMRFSSIPNGSFCIK